MRKIKCYNIPGLSVQEVLDEFNERREEFGVAVEDIVSISSSAPASSIKIAMPDGAIEAKVRLAVFQWSDE